MLPSSPLIVQEVVKVILHCQRLFFAVLPAEYGRPTCEHPKSSVLRFGFDILTDRRYKQD